jgi:hypothetical protein
VEEHVRATVDNARATVDFFISLVYLFAVLGVVSISAALFGQQDAFKLAAVGTAALCLTPAWYRLAVTTTDEWSASVQALVNLGRKPLAAALGLEIPDQLAKERHMWRVVNQFVKSPFDPWIIALLDEYRAKSSATGTGTDALKSLVGALSSKTDLNSARSATSTRAPAPSGDMDQKRRAPNPPKQGASTED